MAWNTPATAAAFGAISSTDYNTYTRDNIAYLSARPLFWKVYDTTSADYTGLTATSWTDIDATNLIATVTTQVTNARVLIEAVMLTSANTGLTYFDWYESGLASRSHTSHSGTTTSAVGVAVNDNTVRLTTVVRGLFNTTTPGAFTFKLQYKTAAGVSTTVFRNARPITISAWEL